MNFFKTIVNFQFINLKYTFILKVLFIVFEWIIYVLYLIYRF